MPAVFVHGVPDTARLWDDVRGHLSRSDVVTPSLPGFASPVPEGFDATKEAYVDWLVAQLESIGEPVDIVGHDWGSLLVQRVVSIRPDLVRTWAAGAGAVDREYVWHDLAQMWQTPGVGEQVMDAMTPDAMADGLGDQLGSRERALAVASRVDETMKRCVLTLYRSAAGGFGEWHDAVDAISCPGLVIWGAQDPYVTPDVGERLARRTHARLVMLDCGHWWPVARPEAVARELETLWSSV